MKDRKIVIMLVFLTVCFVLLTDHCGFAMDAETRKKMKSKVLEMFKHAYGSYMKMTLSEVLQDTVLSNIDHAFPADELMPLSCKGRYRGSEPNRGDVDDSLGNFTLTLIDTLDTLAVVGDIPEFERAVKLVVEHTKFDTDVIVSVFETNIRVLGGLLGGHVFAAFLKRKKLAMDWYKDELLTMAKDIGTRLLPAFNTSTGIPYPRINLKHGISPAISQNYKDTCTSCAGTMILEFAALSRFTGDPVFEEKAHKAMDYLWNQRHRQSDLVGTVINIHNGDWIRRESGVGAGIDSYYEYVLKAYILLGDDTYLTRFNKHYEAVMKYVSQGPRYIDVHMHRPLAPSRNFMDALLAFWPGLQVLKGDIQPAIEMHEMLYQVVQKHNFLPEAFTSDFHIHWSHHPLRPEFVESTYFLYKATGDPYYMEVGQKVVENLDKLARVKCGFAAIKDVSRGTHEDAMDSFVLAETFKYLYLLYTDKDDLLFDIDDYIFTTEAHLLPLSLSRCNTSTSPSMRLSREMYRHLQALEEESQAEDEYGESNHNTCPNPQIKFRQTINYAHNMRVGVKDIVGKAGPNSGTPQQCTNTVSSSSRLKAADFVAGNRAQLQQLQNMGIKLVTMSDGRIQLLHSATDALSPTLAEEGLLFMQEMIELSKNQPQDATNDPVYVQFVSNPYVNQMLRAGPAQFGYDLKAREPIQGMLQIAQPYKVCEPVWNTQSLNGKIAILERGNCMFVDKARHLEKAGAIGGIVIDHTGDSSANTQPMFAMSGDGKDDVNIPLVFLFHAEGSTLLDMLSKHPDLQVMLAAKLRVVSTVTKPAGPTVPTEMSSQDASESHDQDVSQSQSSNSGGRVHIERRFKLDPLTPLEEYNIHEKPDDLEADVLNDLVTADVKETELSADNMIHIQTLNDGVRQLFFRFDKIENLELTEPNLSEIYEKVRFSLYRYTNFGDLDKQSEYLTAVVNLIEAAYFGKSQLDVEVQGLFTDLANELEIIPEDDEEQEGVEPNQQEGVELYEEGAESVISTDQSEEVVKSVGSNGVTQETKVFQEDGMRLQIKVVRNSAQKGGPPVSISGDSYATIEDFEPSQEYRDSKNINKDQQEYRDSKSINIEQQENRDSKSINIEQQENRDSKSINKDQRLKDDSETITEIDIEKEMLNSINKELAEGIKAVNKESQENSQDRTITNSEHKTHSSNSKSNTDNQVFQHKTEITVDSSQSQSSGDRSNTVQDTKSMEGQRQNDEL